MTFTQHVNLIAWSCYSQLLVLPSAASVEPHVPQIRLSIWRTVLFRLWVRPSGMTSHLTCMSSWLLVHLKTFYTSL